MHLSLLTQYRTVLSSSDTHFLRITHKVFKESRLGFVGTLLNGRTVSRKGKPSLASLLWCYSLLHWTHPFRSQVSLSSGTFLTKSMHGNGWCKEGTVSPCLNSMKIYSNECLICIHTNSFLYTFTQLGSRLCMRFLPPTIRHLHIKAVSSAQQNIKSAVMVCLFIVQSPIVILDVIVKLQFGTTSESPLGLKVGYSFFRVLVIAQPEEGSS